MGTPFIVFGLIFLLVTLVAGKYMMKEPENPNCSEDVVSVKTNKKTFKILLTIEALVIIAGIILLFV